MPSPAKDPIRILLVDDHAIVRAGLRLLIETQPEMLVVGEAAGPADAVELVAREQPDIILLDLALGGASGLDSLREMRAAAARARVLIVTGVNDPEQHRRAVRLGAMGLVLKDQAAEVLIKAINKVHEGEAWFDRQMTASLLAELSHASVESQATPEQQKIAQLTPREREIIGFVCEGLKNKQIAARLFISEATVRNHLTSILGKLELSDRFELALFSFRHGLAKPPQ